MLLQRLQHISVRGVVVAKNLVRGHTMRKQGVYCGQISRLSSGVQRRKTLIVLYVKEIGIAGVHLPDGSSHVRGAELAGYLVVRVGEVVAIQRRVKEHLKREVGAKPVHILRGVREWLHGEPVWVEVEVVGLGLRARGVSGMRRVCEVVGAPNASEAGLATDMGDPRNLCLVLVD